VTPETEISVRAHDLSFSGEHTDVAWWRCVCYQEPHEFANIEAPEGPTTVVIRPPAGLSGLQDGGICFVCGGMTVRTGTCTTCTECGETGGCG
jgi:hypothetical protein